MKTSLLSLVFSPPIVCRESRLVLAKDASFVYFQHARLVDVMSSRKVYIQDTVAGAWYVCSHRRL